MENSRLDLNIADAMMIGGDLFRASRFAEAEGIFSQIAEADPLNFHAHNALAVCLIEQNKGAQALPSLQRAGLLLRDEMVTVSSNRGRALADIGQADEALAAFEGVLKACPDHLISIYNRGLVFLQLGRCAEAIADFDKVLEADPGNDKARFGRGFASLVQGHYADGFRDYECRLKDTIDEPDVPLWTGEESLKGKTILVHGEQGLGDNIMFGRYLPMLQGRGARVLVWTPEPVRPLLLPLGVTVLPDDRDAWPAFDTWVRFMSLAYCFRTTEASVPPPLPLDLGKLDQSAWRVRIKQGQVNIGLCWSGSPQSRYDEHRSIPLEQLRPLIEDSPFIQFYSLQKGVRERDRPAFEEFTRSGRLIDLDPLLPDFLETARAMKFLNGVITVDTSVAHLAGTVGVSTLVMLTAFRTYWLWIEKQKRSPWYPSVRVLRQERDGDWEQVVRAALSNLIAA